MSELTSDDVPLACDLGALDERTRAAHLALAGQLMHGGAAEVRDLPDGYAFLFDAAQYGEVAQFVANERLCCPFFAFALEVAPAHGPLWLRITGGQGVKEFLHSELVQC